MRPAPGPPKSKRVYSLLSAVAGGLLLAFEVSRLGGSRGEGWFWIAVAVLMIALGLFGFFQRPEKPPEL